MGNKSQWNGNQNNREEEQNDEHNVKENENKDVTEAEHMNHLDDEFKEKCKVKETCIL